MYPAITTIKFYHPYKNSTEHTTETLQTYAGTHRLPKDEYIISNNLRQLAKHHYKGPKNNHPRSPTKCSPQGPIHKHHFRIKKYRHPSPLSQFSLKGP